MENIKQECAVCSKPTSKACSACGKVYYCGVEHQKLDRKSHKLNCFPCLWIKNKENHIQLLATKDISLGELILTENSVTSLPAIPSGEDDCENDSLICLGCNKIIGGNNAETPVLFYNTCALCHWPVCSEKCEKDYQHSDAECKILVQNQIQFLPNKNTVMRQLVILIRCLLLKKSEPKSWQKLVKIVHERNFSKGMDFENKELSKLATSIKGICDQFNSSNISYSRLLKTIKLNSCIQDGVSFMFSQASLLPHSCISNTRRVLEIKSDSRRATLNLKASVNISKGQLITTSYDSYGKNYIIPLPLLGTYERRLILKNCFNISCSCTRCVDRLELKTYFSAIKCTANNGNCSSGYLLCSEPLNNNSKWICNVCKNSCSINIAEIKPKWDFTSDTEIIEDLKILQNTLSECEGVIFHTNHYYFAQLKYRAIKKLVSSLQGQGHDGASMELDGNKNKLREVYEEVYNYCLFLLTLADVLSPGSSVLREELLSWLVVVSDCLTQIYNELKLVFEYVVKLKEREKWTRESQELKTILKEKESKKKSIAPEEDDTKVDVNVDDFIEVKCATCSKPCPDSKNEANNMSCSNCKKVFYCGGKHKKSYSKKHEKNDECYPAIVTEDETQGRYLVATRDIQIGEIIFKERALVCSPSSVGGSQFHRVCLGCYRTVKTSNTCSKCQWPICDSECEKASEHAGKECAIFASHKVPQVTKNYQYEFLKALRCLLVRDSDRDKWTKIMKLESHVESRKHRPIRVQLSFEAIDFIRSKCNQTQFEPELIDFIIGVNAVNAFGLQLPASSCSPGGSELNNEFRTGSFLFYNGSMMSHNCEPNSSSKYCIATNSPNKALLDCSDCTINLTATKLIKKGQSITTTYVDLTKSTVERQRLLNEGYYFLCSCKRCSDPGELEPLYLAKSIFNNSRY